MTNKPSEPVVFVVDDDEAVRDSLRMLLESDGLEVDAFASGAEFLAADLPGRGGCVVLDVRLGDMNGLDLQKKLAALRIELPVILITGHGDIPMAVAAMKAGAADFIEKPFADGVLLDSVRRALGAASPASGKAPPDTESEFRIARLSPREREVLEHLTIGRPNKLIAAELGISPRTVEIHRARVMEKTEAKSLSHLVRMALAAGIDPEPS